MIVDARTLPDGSAISAQICIIGAGAAGITLAREFAGQAFDVCVIESGGLEYDQNIQDLYRGESIGHKYHALDIARLRFFGGTTNHWGGYCRPLDPQDFETRSYIPDSGWPFSRADLDPFYERAQPICGLGEYVYDDTLSDKAGVPAFKLDSTKILSRVFQIDPTRFGIVYREDIDSAPNVRTLLFANVTEIVTDGPRVTELRVTCLPGATGDGKRFSVKAPVVILAAGAIENARLLLTSNKEHAAGIGNTHDNVGRYFMDHPVIWESGQMLVSGSPEQAQFYREHDAGDTKLIGFFTLPRDVFDKEQIPNCGILIEDVTVWKEVGAVASVKHIWGDAKQGKIPDDFATHLGRIIDDFGELMDAAYYKIVKPPPNQYRTRFWCECPPDRESRMTLYDERDALGLRRVRLDWKLPDMTRVFRRMHELLAQEIGRQDLGRMQIGKDGDIGEALASAEDSFHQMGTTRMHESAAKGVVDANCKVHGMNNLFIAGSSVFPTYGHANPTLTIVALALRLADHVKKLV
jgi:choline dehydrogenase-like flavoprotein